jgi:hypothetical protein
MSWLRSISLYTLLLLTAGVAAGFIFGIINRVVGLEHEWGTLDASAVIRVLVTLAISAGVFSALARRRPGEYYSVGAGVVVLTAILNTAFAYLLAPPAAREAFNWGALVAWPLVFNAIALVIVGLVMRFRKSSSNNSFERTREG